MDGFVRLLETYGGPVALLIVVIQQGFILAQRYLPAKMKLNRDRARWEAAAEAAQAKALLEAQKQSMDTFIALYEIHSQRLKEIAAALKELNTTVLDNREMLAIILDRTNGVPRKAKTAATKKAKK